MLLKFQNFRLRFTLKIPNRMVFYIEKNIHPIQNKLLCRKNQSNFMLTPKEKGGNLTVKKNFKFVYVGRFSFIEINFFKNFKMWL